MPERPFQTCKRPGCPELTRNRSGYCDKHIAEYEQRKEESNRLYEKSRGGSTKQGYNYRWQQRSKWFLRQPGNQICKLHLPGCTLIATCVDHIDPPDGPNDPRFWDETNWQPSCIHCNSVKGHKKMKGTFEL